MVLACHCSLLFPPRCKGPLATPARGASSVHSFLLLFPKLLRCSWPGLDPLLLFWLRFYPCPSRSTLSKSGLVRLLQQRRPLQTASSEADRGEGILGLFCLCLSVGQGDCRLSRHSRAPVPHIRNFSFGASHRSCCVVLPGVAPTLCRRNQNHASFVVCPAVRSFCIYLPPKANSIVVRPAPVVSFCSFPILFSHPLWERTFPLSISARLSLPILFCSFSPISLSTFHFHSRVWRRIPFSASILRPSFFTAGLILSFCAFSVTLFLLSSTSRLAHREHTAPSFQTASTFFTNKKLHAGIRN